LSKQIERFDNEWEYIPATKEIRRKIKSGFSKTMGLFWKRKYKVKTLYFWTSDNWATREMMIYDIPMDRDRINKPKSLPNYFSLINGWSIPRKDLSTLKYGPLMSDDGASK
jgi:hypothetical protein